MPPKAISFIPGLVNKLKAKLPSAPDVYSFIENTAEIPYFVGKSFNKQLKGKRGLVGLKKGILPGAGMAAGSVATDKAMGNDVSAGRAAGLGSLGLVAPSLMQASRAAQSTLRSYLNTSTGLRNSGIAMMPFNALVEKGQRWMNFRDKGAIGAMGALINRRERLRLGSLLRPSKRLEVQTLSNDTGFLNPKLLRTASRRFGKTELDAGAVINPNVARLIQGGKADQILRDAGFKKFMGSKPGTKRVGSELLSILEPRYKNILGKGAQPGLPTGESMFPFTTRVLDRDVTFGVGRAHKTGPRAGDFNASYAYKDLPIETKQWLRTQNVRGAGDYLSLVDMIDRYVGHMSRTASKNPAHFKDPKFAIPSIKTLPASERKYPFYHKL